MVIGGLLAILIAIWVYRTALEAKTGNALFWVAGSFILFLGVQVAMIYFNILIIETFDQDSYAEYDSAGGLNARDNSDTAGIQSGPGGTFIGIIFEILPFVVPFFVVAIVRQMIMLKQAFAFKGLFDGLKETLVSIKDSFSTSSEKS
ncbi:MAG: hypothetical protein KAH20_04060 [Methylococcales bacterium]|nr:hypothetical protein [Methylococcales bacterium]